MARRPRIENAGYHHIYNRGVERRVVFAQPKDKEKFLDIVCEVSEHYDFIIHGYVIILHSKNNGIISLKRLIKSWYVHDEAYLFTLFKYLNPKEKKIIKKNAKKRVVKVAKSYLSQQ